MILRRGHAHLELLHHAVDRERGRLLARRELLEGLEHFGDVGLRGNEQPPVFCFRFFLQGEIEKARRREEVEKEVTFFPASFCSFSPPKRKKAWKKETYAWSITQS